MRWVGLASTGSSRKVQGTSVPGMERGLMSDDAEDTGSALLVAQ